MLFEISNIHTALQTSNLSTLRLVPDVSLANENTRVVNTLGQTKLKHLRLQPAFQEVLQTKSEHVIQLHLRLIQYADTHQPTKKGIAYRVIDTSSCKCGSYKDVKLLLINR